MGIMVYSLLWVMQDFVHQPYVSQWSHVRNKDANTMQMSGSMFKIWNIGIMDLLNLDPVWNVGVSEFVILELKTCGKPHSEVKTRQTWGS